MKKNVLLTIGIGCIAGIGMALLVLYMMDMALYKLFSASFYLMCIVVCALPHCFLMVKKVDLSCSPLVMILVSCGITILYGGFVSRGQLVDHSVSSLYVMTFFLHGVSLVSWLIGFLLKRKKR